MANDNPFAPRYTDSQVLAATGLPIDSLRRLITWGAVRPAQAGGGRGRVRLWTTGQALRISVTSQLAAGGFSLQMAHTLAYCVPISNLTLLFEPEALLPTMARRSNKEAKGLLESLTLKRQPKVWPAPGEHAASQILILDRQFVYISHWEVGFELVAEIDPDQQRVIPIHDPEREAESDAESDESIIDKSSLLIDRRYLSGKGSPKRLSEHLEIRTKNLDMIMCKSLLSINLSLGFMLCVRQLQGFETKYSPGWIGEDDEE